MTRDFKGVWIPKEIWLDERLNALEKIIFVEIDSLCSGERGCFASNSYLAQFCQCSETKISKAISKLIELGYLYVVSFNGRQRELQSCLAKNARQDNKKCKAAEQKMQGSIYNDINNKNNNINNNKEREIKKRENAKRFSPPTVQEVKEYCLERGNNIDAEKFVAFYQSKGWKVGNNSMKDWKSAIITWEKRDEYSPHYQNKNTSSTEQTINYDIAAYESFDFLGAINNQLGKRE